MSGESVRENIYLNLKTTLEGVTVANGYRNTIQSVQRIKQDAQVTVSIPAVVIAAGDEREDPAPDPLVTCVMTVYLLVYTRDDPDDSNPADTRVNSLLSDIKKALQVDNTMGGYALDTNTRGNAPFDTEDAQANVGIIIEVEIVYEHLRSDPEQTG